MVFSALPSATTGPIVSFLRRAAAKGMGPNIRSGHLKDAALAFEAPVKDLMFNIAHIATWSDPSDPAGMAGQPACDLDIAAAVLEEFGRFCAEEIAPLNATGDRAGSQFENGSVVTPPGFRAAYARFTAMGWQGLQHPEIYGGLGLPRAVGAATTEIVNAANMSFA